MDLPRYVLKITNPPSKEPELLLSEEARIRLGHRAKRRRAALGITMADCAKAIGIKPYTLRQWEECLILRPKVAVEDRWEDLLQAPRGWLRSEALGAQPVQVHGKLSLDKADSVAAEIRLVGCWLARGKAGRRTSDFNALTVAEQRNALIFARRYGVAGHEQSRLQSIGDDFDLTRERIRQITDRQLERAAGLDTPTPTLDHLRDALLPTLPATMDDIDERFRKLLGESLSIADANRFSTELLGRSLIHMTDNPGGMMATRMKAVLAPQSDQAHDQAVLRAVRRATIRMVRSAGAAHIATICADAAATLEEGLTPEEALTYCQLLHGFSWLSEETGWFWLGCKTPRKNRLMRATQKILYIADRRLDVETIYQGFLRSRRHISEKIVHRQIFIEPPMAIVAEVLRQTPWLDTVQYDDFEFREPPNTGGLISDAESQLVSAFREAGGTMARRTLLRRFVNEGDMNLITFQVALENSPIFTKFEAGLYGLRGWPLDLRSITAALQAKVEMVVDEQAVEADKRGWLSFDYTIGAMSMRDHHIRVPNAIARMVPDGQYTELESKIVATLHTPSSGANSYLKGLLQHLDTQLTLGQQLRVEINPKSNQVRILEKNLKAI